MHLLLLSLGVTSNVVKRNEDVFYIIVDQKLATDSESFLPLDKIKKIKLKFVFQLSSSLYLSISKSVFISER